MAAKVARLIIRAIILACPDCGAYVRSSNGEATIRPDASDKWDILTREPIQCDKCHAWFRLPANPFK